MHSKYVNEDCWYVPVCMGAGKECRSCLKYFEMSYLMEHSGLPKSKQKPVSELIPYTDHDIASFQRLDEIRLDIENFVQTGSNLYIASKYTGNGKTSWAIKLLLRYFDRIWGGNGHKVRGLFVHVPTLLLRLKNFNSPMSKDEYALLKECDLIVWDDIASIDLTNYDFAQLNALVDYRLLADKSNIYTSNIPEFDKLCGVLGDRLASRIYKSSEVIIFNGKDNRQYGRSSSSSNIE